MLHRGVPILNEITFLYQTAPSTDDSIHGCLRHNMQKFTVTLSRCRYKHTIAAEPCIQNTQKIEDIISATVNQSSIPDVV